MRLTKPDLARVLLACGLAWATGPGAGLRAQTYDELVTDAMAAVATDSLERAEALFRRALAVDPGSARNALLFANLGTVQRRMGRTDEALESYTLSLNIAPRSVVTLLDRASLYLEQNLLGRAYVDYSTVLDVEPLNREALQYRAYISLQRREYDRAKADYDLLLREEPGHYAARLGRAVLFQNEGRYREALDDLTRLVTDHPADASLLKARASLEVETGTPDLALLDLEEAARLAPDDAEIYVMCGEIYLSRKQKREAYAAFEKAVALGVPRPRLQDRLKAAR